MADPKYADLPGIVSTSYFTIKLCQCDFVIKYNSF